jgi:hypothetical protein
MGKTAMRVWLASAGIMVLGLAAIVVAHRGPEGPSVESLEAFLLDESPSVRAAAAEALGQRFPDGAHAAPMLVELVEDEDPVVADAAARALDSLAVVGASVVADAVPNLVVDGTGGPLYLLASSSPTWDDIESCVSEDGSSAFAATALIVAPYRPAELLDRLAVWSAGHSSPWSRERPAACAAAAMLGVDLISGRHRRPSGEDEELRIGVTRRAKDWMRSGEPFQAFAGARPPARDAVPLLERLRASEFGRVRVAAAQALRRIRRSK